MLPALEQLLILQDRDKKIRTLKQELKTAPLERKELDAKLAAANSQFEAAKLKLKELEIEKKNQELSAQSKRDSIAKFRNQQFQTRKNEEFQALTNEIKRYEADVQTIEDQELEVMEQIEQAKIALLGAEKEFAQAKAQIAQQVADLEQKTKALEAQLKEIEADRAKLAAEVEEDLLERYDRIFMKKGEAIVALEHHVCMGCHMTLTPQTVHRAKGEREIVHCEQCGRMLYYTE